MLYVLIYLQSKPRVGVVAGISSGGILAIQNSFFTHDIIMRCITDISIVASCIVAVSSAVVWVFKLRRIFNNKTPNTP